jgi:hypothetical protein
MWWWFFKKKKKEVEKNEWDAFDEWLKYRSMTVNNTNK